jgi:hypothetical protein
MSITRRITFRLYPSKAQNEKLHYWRKLHKLLYNACVSKAAFGWEASHPKRATKEALITSSLGNR